MKRQKFDTWDYAAKAYGPYSAGYNVADFRTITTSGTTMTTAGSFQIAASSPAMRNQPEGPLEWLDRRVEEVCLSL